MPKTIAITPSWYWPAGVSRVIGVPSYSIHQLCLERNERDRPGQIALIDAEGQLTFGELLEQVEQRARSVGLTAGESRMMDVPGELSRENLLQLLAGLAAGVRVRLGQGDGHAPGPDSAAEAVGTGELLAAFLDPASAAVAIDAVRGQVWHSNKSLMAMAISMITYLDTPRDGAWLATLPLWRWEGLMSVLAPLYLGVSVVLAPARADPDALLGLISRHRVSFAVAGLEPFAHACREAKRAAKDARRMLSAALLAVDGPFDPDQRRRVSKSLECPALTFWGMPETGPVFAAHQSWYLDESVGLPMTNAHVVPADPRSGEPIQALWELVEMAEVTVFSPSLMVGYEGQDASEYYRGSCFRTGMMASSDANGMIYLLGT